MPVSSAHGSPPPRYRSTVPFLILAVVPVYQMMMMAQRSQAEIQGIEIDLAAFKTAKKKNIVRVPGKTGRLKVWLGDVRNYALPAKYDFIITNPPFENDLVSAADNEQVAKHSKHLYTWKNW